MSTSNYLYVIFGAPTSGKSTMLDYLKKNNINIITKETTRTRRINDGDEVKNVQNISESNDIRYFQYMVEYGAKTSDIWDSFNVNKSAAIIINDIRSIKLLQRKFGVLVKTIYLHRNLDPEKIRKIEKERKGEKPDFAETETRINKVNTVLRKYIDNTSLFNYTILNIGSIEVFYKQIDQIIQDNVHDGSIVKSNLRLFIIVGSTLSGKDEMVRAMQQMAVEKVRLYIKLTNRPVMDDDKGELSHVNEMPENADVVYEKNGHTYGIVSSEIWHQLSQGKSILLVVSDDRAINALKAKFRNICTVIYLHANLTKERIIEYLQANGYKEREIEKRVEAMDEIFDFFVSQLSSFSHVLLNTSEKEDLYDQVFNILDYYTL